MLLNDTDLAAGEALAVADDNKPNAATEINAEHRAVLRSGRESVEHAIRAGELLTAEKKRHRHGEWKKWLDAHCECSVRTEQLYRWLAERKEDAQRIAHLGVAGVAAALREAEKDQLHGMLIAKAASRVPERDLVLSLDGVLVGDGAGRPRRSAAVRGYLAALDEALDLLGDVSRGILTLAEMRDRLTNQRVNL